MNESSRPSTSLHSSSQGHDLAAATWLDAHFESKRPEYEAILRSVGLYRGWHVLDAGSGSGAYLHLIANVVGPTGKITALDLAPENIAAINERLERQPPICPVQSIMGNLIATEFPDNMFDAVWFANTAQYLTDDELEQATREFRRIVRSGGLVAIKDPAVTLWNIAPGDPTRLWRLIDAIKESDRQVHGLLRTPELGNYLARSGFNEVRTTMTPVVRQAPLLQVERQYVENIFAWIAKKAEGTKIPDSDLAFWRTLAEREPGASPFDADDFLYYDIQVLAVGRVPTTA
jgi:arsenite methyltransferase